ncbi:hypothetical protein K439DRAFT_1650049 [Ramaria rubella]|nr:hypothetical protein K439DRAFT_1650049 [Ramaria rubella]
MPRQTERQALTNELLELFVLQTLAEGQAELLKLLDTDSETSESEDGDPPLPQLSSLFLSVLADLHATRYLQERIHIPKTHPALFRSLLRVTPSTFDVSLSKIQDHPVFQSNSEKQQIPVNQQLAVVLYRFGHYGNAASMQKVGLWAGLGYGTVDKCTRRVMKAVCDEGFRRVVMRWPDDIQREEASRWGFRAASTMRWHGRGLGYPRSTSILLGRDEWVWADTAYPLQTWCQAPYKKPDKDLPENTRYNYYVSRVRVRSEHCVGFLKGRWSSLRGLRLHIDKPSHIRVATIWVSACIILHNFAMLQEAEEGEGGDIELNEFFREGLSLLEEEQRLRDGCNAHGELNDCERDHAGGHDVDMIRGALRREELKKTLFEQLGY